VKSIEHLSMF